MAKGRAGTVIKVVSSEAKRVTLQQTVTALHQKAKVKAKAAKAKVRVRERIKDLAAKVKARAKVRRLCAVLIVASSDISQPTVQAEAANQSISLGTIRILTLTTRKVFLIPIQCLTQAR